MYGWLLTEVHRRSEVQQELHRFVTVLSIWTLQIAGLDAEQADGFVKLNPLQAVARGASYQLGVSSGVCESEVARNRFEVVETQLDTDLPGHVALSLEISGNLLAQTRER